MTDRDKGGHQDEPEVLEAESIEYMPGPNDSGVESASGHPNATAQDPRVFVYQQNQTPCCGGCGCLAGALIFLYLFHGVSIINWILVIAATVISARFFMNIAGVPRWSSWYPMIFIPVFIALLSVINHFMSGNYLFTFGQFLVISAIAMFLLYIVRGRRQA